MRARTQAETVSEMLQNVNIIWRHFAAQPSSPSPSLLQPFAAPPCRAGDGTPGRSGGEGRAIRASFFLPKTARASNIFQIFRIQMLQHLIENTFFPTCFHERSPSTGGRGAAAAGGAAATAGGAAGRGAATAGGAGRAPPKLFQPIRGPAGVAQLFHPSLAAPKLFQPPQKQTRGRGCRATRRLSKPMFQPCFGQGAHPTEAHPCRRPSRIIAGQ